MPPEGYGEMCRREVSDIEVGVQLCKTRFRSRFTRSSVRNNLLIDSVHCSASEGSYLSNEGEMAAVRK